MSQQERSVRQLGRSGIAVSALGLGCWAIGGPFWRGAQPVGWGAVDDAASLQALRRGLALGITFFDTADVYGCGHSERVPGQALAGHRHNVVIATKFGNVFDEATRHITGRDASPSAIRRSCTESLRRLGTDYIDLYQLHLGDYPLEQAVQVRATLEDLVAEGTIRSYAWSTDDPERARLFAQGPYCTAVQHQLNLFNDTPAMLALCADLNLASITRGPLAMGVLTGKFSAGTQVPQDDLRHGWDFRQGAQAAQLRQLDAVREVLTAGGRTPAQGALGWLWARSGQTVPIPGFKTAQQVEESAGALRFGPLSQKQLAEIDALLGRPPVDASGAVG
jgi:aryl-alcohol dehydrogenase-like predicted oxidoreductase